MKRLVIATFVVFTLFSSCVNYFAARDIMHNYPKHYNGIDTLIRIDGYYYYSSNKKIVGPSFFEIDGTFRIVPISFTDHLEVKSHLSQYFHSTSNGFFIVCNDTIKVKWADRYDVLSYDLYEETFLIQNDTTLIRVFYSYTTASEQQINTDTIVFKFYHFEFDRKKFE